MPAESANLVRIRDNQRRSRARRKLYTQDLENRLRHFERRGFEVTAEVQVAARKVAKENCRLRSLLNLHGVTNAEIEEHLRENDGSAVASAAPAGVVTPTSSKLAAASTWHTNQSK
ncbi:MAG: hypothetical protein LQ343_000419 [Gyalolechia ehrenbergii]|nr:MAG: hypothetical protein LQ343_000419 [Gyalolechia ehrenbergii]